MVEFAIAYAAGLLTPPIFSWVKARIWPAAEAAAQAEINKVIPPASK